MKLLIFGNIASGKSMLVSKVNNILKWKVVAIDDFRREYGDGSKESELLARRKFFDTIYTKVNQIIECTGVGKVGEELFFKLRNSNEKIVLVLLKVSQDISKKRLIHRTWDIPFPSPLEKVNPLIDKNDVVINSRFIEKTWGAIPGIKILVRENKNYEELDSITNDLLLLLDHSV